MELSLLILLFITIFFYFQVKDSEQAKKSKKVILDTSSLIDGRVVSIADAGFLPEELIVTTSVLHELQLLADGRDTHKRQRARYGLSVLKELQKNRTVKTINDRSTRDLGVDDSLRLLAKKKGYRLMTTDFNLAEVAQSQGVQVLNPNKLAGALRPQVLPGETIEVKIIQKGEQARQGIGYLPDGTLVVVDGAGSHQSQMVTAVIDKYHQTDSGKMIFAHRKK